MRLTPADVSAMADEVISYDRFNFINRAPHITDGCQSHIEERLALAIDGWFNHAMGMPVSFWHEPQFEWTDKADIKFAPMSVYKQAKVGPYRVDFLVGFKLGDEQAKFFVVECDGHAFHERTKEQAAHDRSRDRWMTQNNLPVYRFTGSEIHRDALGCASEIFNACMKNI